MVAVFVQGPIKKLRSRLTSKETPTIKMRRLHDRLVFIMGISMQVRRRFMLNPTAL